VDYHWALTGSRYNAAVEWEMTAIASSKAITKWNILALVCGVVGTAATLGLDHLWLKSWADSGQGFRVGRQWTANLPQGQTLVYYESKARAPIGDVTLYITDSDGERVRALPLEADINYRLWFNQWSGRALWQLDLPRADQYQFRCSNHNFAYDSDVPADDRVVFFRTPDSLAEVSFTRKIIQGTGAAITIGLIILFYFLHGLELGKRRALAEPLMAPRDIGPDIIVQ